MKLLRISIHGFKSFADKVEIDIKEGITGVVGPNGSGKSNIVDAVKWVLGEQSVKDIRGGMQMSDVIFGGSKSRGALTRAWVALTFDNADHGLKNDLTEIEIKRVVYRTGENEYYINNEQVRLKDVTDLFIDSGSSVNSLSIISQGKIGDIINSKPEDKIHILEEAAGVLKYKKRKEEALRKLDKTNDNLSRIALITDELMVNIAPLKAQALVASEYLNYKKDLENTEIALLAHDIKTLNEEGTDYKNKAEKLKQAILTMDNTNIIDSAKVDSLKLKCIKLEEEISSKSGTLYELTGELSRLMSEKQIMLERQKYKVDDAKLEANILGLKEKELQLKSNIKAVKEDLKLKEENLKKQADNHNKLLNDLRILNISKNTLLNELGLLNKEELALKNKIEITSEQIENESRLPYAVKSVLNNQRLSGIHSTIGKLIETNEKEAYAIDIALGFAVNVVVVDHENAAKEAINYLKSNNIGRVTFFPLNVIKPRGVDANTLIKIKNDPDFLGVAADLVKYNLIYRNIILNQLGNVLVVTNLAAANKIGKLINYMYKIVTLEGDLIASGGSITGGANKNANGLLNQKFELEKLITLAQEKEKHLKVKEEAVNDNNHELKLLETNIFNSENELNALKEAILRRYSEVAALEQEIEVVVNELKGTKGVLNKVVDQEIEQILSKYYEVNSKKEALEITLNDLKASKNDIQSEINELELNNKKINTEFNHKQNELKELEVMIGKLDIRLETALMRLNEEYSITYEKALAEYSLEVEINAARLRVNSLKQKIKALGEVNLGAITEYERVNTRYTFLNTQKEDLEVAINDILVVINELDETMKKRLLTTFDELNAEFAKVFNKLFKGGEASLTLSNPDDILNTGLDIHAVPPGKDIKNTRLLSGGESTLTVIALLFAILNIRTVPFCILDEVESALDEPNVDMFGNYLKGLNSKTQFILITHKKRTMEHTDNLYGITMQESGVSKLVSVKLD